MLTIENIERIKYKVIGNTGYYVSNMKPVVITNIKAPHKSTHYYEIELTNRREYQMVNLEREGIGPAGPNGLIIYSLNLGNSNIWINQKELKDIDALVGKLNKLILQQYVP